MSCTLSLIETPPAAYPPAPTRLSPQAATMDPIAIWQRIERYIVYRWTPRQAICVVEGDGEWRFPLTPATVTKTEAWRGNAWQVIDLPASPLDGFCLPCGKFRITATVGAPPVPAVVNEAFRRLAEYIADGQEHAGYAGFRHRVGDVEIDLTRPVTGAARNLQLSGAADLLRAYRRLP